VQSEPWVHSMARLNTYIVDNYVQVNNNINGRYCWKMVTRTRNNVTLHVNLLLFTKTS